MNDIEIRRLVPEDLDKWFELRLEGLRSIPEAFLSSPEQEQKRGIGWLKDKIRKEGDENVLFGALTQGGKVIGTLGLVREHHQKSNHRAIIWGMYVTPDFREKGVGRRLMEAVIEHAREKLPIRLINLSVESENLAAKNLYTKMGFIHWATEKDFLQVDGKFYDEAHMVYRI